MKTYLNDAIIGNKDVKVGLTEKGEIVRICYPNIDFRQFIEFMHMGVKVNDSNLIYLHDDINNVYEQHYIEDTNVLKTEIRNTYFNLKMIQTDFVAISHNVIIRKYTFINEHDIPLDIKFLVHSKMKSDDNNFASSKVIQNGMLQYSHGYNMAVISNSLKLLSHKIHGTDEVIRSGILQDKDYIGMSSQAAVSYDVGTLKPMEVKEFSVCIYISDNKEKNKFEEIEEQIDKIKRIDVEKELQNTKKYWRKYVKNHSKLELEGTRYKETIRNIYTRTILLFPLLTNLNTGGMSAAMEIDEKFTKCGRYAYCWPRDSVYITKALDLINMEKETEKFYKVFCKNTQSRNGMWEQRFYTDCTLAPCWGYQIDETAGIVYGIYDHYTRTKDKKFLQENLKMVEKAIKFLENYVEDIIENKKEIQVSYDLWEMHEGVSIYSLASIFAAFEAMQKIYDALAEDLQANRLKQETIIKQKEIIEKQLIQIKNYVIEKLYDETKKSFVRNLDDRRLDISILGVTIPFRMFSPNEKKITNTIERINLNLRTYTSGYLRFENDHYTEDRPWVVATLWMALYYIETKDYKKAKECFDFVVATSTKHGFLAEQVDNHQMKSAWVIGLGWSHAMFIIVLDELMKLNLI